jgi:uncharacterized HAD superfamily protein
VLLGLDLDGVLCDIGPSVSLRLSRQFGVSSHPDTWRTYDLRHLRLGVPEVSFCSFLDETFADPALYEEAPVADGAANALGHLVDAGWDLVGITARAGHLAEATTSWLAAHRLPVAVVHHCEVGSKATIASSLGVQAAIEDNPREAELLGEVCQSWLLDRPYNRDHVPVRASRLVSWDDAVGRLCQLSLFA